MKILAWICIWLLPLLGTAQTNQWFKKGDLTFSLGPGLSAASLQNANNEFGWEAQVSYFQTESTATVISTGDLDARHFNPELIDHLAALEEIRMVPFAKRPTLGRFDVLLITGTDTRFFDGSKGVLIGIGAEVALSQDIYLSGSAKEGFETVAKDSGMLYLISLEYKF